jgi:hypothetical protein
MRIFLQDFGLKETAWIEYCNQERNSLSRAAIQTKPLNVFKRVKEMMTYKKHLHMLVGSRNLKIEFSCIILKLPMRRSVQKRTRHMYEDLKNEKIVQSKLLKAKLQAYLQE